MAPVLAKHRNAIFMNEALFRRVDAIFQRVPTSTSPQSKPACSIAITPSSRGQARLEPSEGAGRRHHRALGDPRTQFSQNVLADEKAYALVLEGEPDLAGLPTTFLREAAARAADERRLQASTSSRSRDQASSRSSPSRAGATCTTSRFKAWVSPRGDTGGPADNKAIIAEMVSLRAERARTARVRDLRGFQARDTMAKSPEHVASLLRRSEAGGSSCRRRARRPSRPSPSTRGQRRDRTLGLALLRRAGAPRAPRHRRGEDQAVFQLERMVEVAFETAHRLFGLSFTEPRTFPAITRTSGSGRSATRTAISSASSSATTSRGLRSAAAPG